MSDAWEEYERAQKNRRSDRMPKRRAEVEALRGKGYNVRELAFGHFRIDGKLDLYLLHRRFHFLPTNERGGYMKVSQIAPEMLRRRRKQRSDNPNADAEILSDEKGKAMTGAHDSSSLFGVPQRQEEKDVTRQSPASISEGQDLRENPSGKGSGQ